MNHKMETKKENQNWYNLMLQMDLEHARHSTYIPKFERRLLKRRTRQKNAYEFILGVKDLPK